jgi:hypothetical protein
LIAEEKDCSMYPPLVAPTSPEADSDIAAGFPKKKARKIFANLSPNGVRVRIWL